MYKQILPGKPNKEQALQPNRSKELVAYESTQLVKQACPERSISPWESEENSIKNQNLVKEKFLKNIPEQKRSLELTKISQNHFYSKSISRKSNTKISKDCLLLIKKQKNKNQLHKSSSPSNKTNRLSKIQMNLNDQQISQIASCHKSIASTSQNPEIRYFHKDLPTKVKIHKKLAEDYRKRAQQTDKQSSQIYFKTFRVFPNSKNTKKYEKKVVNIATLRKQMPASKRSQYQKKFTLQDFYNLDPLRCKGGIISHQQSKKIRKLRFRNNLAIELSPLDAQAFFYKI